MMSEEFLKSKHNSPEAHQFIDYLFDNAVFDYSEIPQNLITIHAGIGINDHSGTTTKISNIKLNLLDLLKSAILISNQIVSGDPMNLMLIFVDCISVIFNKARKILNSEDCMVLLSINEINQKNINENFLKKFVTEQYNISPLKFQRAIANLLHLKCIKIENENIELVEKICIRYDY